MHYCGVWNPTIQNPSKHKKSGLFGDHVLKGQARAIFIAVVPTIWKLDHQFLSRFQMFSVLIVAIHPDFKWLGFWISDSIQTDLFHHSKSGWVQISDPHLIQILLFIVLLFRSRLLLLIPTYTFNFKGQFKLAAS